MKINYKIKEVKPNIFAIIVKDKYDRAMLFCRAQEYYESPSAQFRGKEFSIWEYMKWYHKQYGHGFSYGQDWSGFNIPLKILRECSYKLNKIETPYDKIMDKILLYDLKHANQESYIIGCSNTTGETFKHEVCHGLYYTNKEYKKRIDSCTKELPPKNYNIFKKNLQEMGYANKVVNDEIQAYLQYGYDNDQFGKGVDIEIRKTYHDKYQLIGSNY